jgi:hypothetical protein
MTNRPEAMRRTTKKPAPERMANTGLTWALVPRVVKGTVDGADGKRLPSGAMVVDVVGAVGVVSTGAKVL